MRAAPREPLRMSIQELGEAAGVSVRNVQKYISLGLLHRPLGKARHAHYVDSHLEDLRYVRSLMAADCSLARAKQAMDARRAEQEAAASRVDVPALFADGLLRAVPLQGRVVLLVPGSCAISEDLKRRFDAMVGEMVGLDSQASSQRSSPSALPFEHGASAHGALA